MCLHTMTGISSSCSGPAAAEEGTLTGRVITTTATTWTKTGLFTPRDARVDDMSTAQKLLLSRRKNMVQRLQLFNRLDSI